MQIQYKVNTGEVKKSKHEYSVFRESDADKLEMLESVPMELFETFLRGGIKNLSGGISDLDMRDKVNFNILRHRGINSVSYDKKVRGCFIIYVFEVK